ncbi:hypothetical protein DRQ53_12005 [bacterium]|nr:MAG: hypothetical protein DRQ53_12005 [bacterium]
MPNRSRQKGDRAERELRDILRAAGVHVRKIPSSGAGPDFPGDLYVGDDGSEEIWEVKVRNQGFTRIYAWLLDASVLAFRAMGRQGVNREWIVTLRLSDLLRIAREGKL